MRGQFARIRHGRIGAFLGGLRHNYVFMLGHTELNTLGQHKGNFGCRLRTGWLRHTRILALAGCKLLFRVGKAAT